MPVKKYGQGDSESEITWHLDGRVQKTIKQKDLDKILSIIDEYFDLIECIDEQ